MENLEEARTINIHGIANILEAKIPSNLNFKIDVMVVDENTALPFSIFYSPKAQEVKNKEVVIVCHDFFDNYLEKTEFYNSFVKKLENYILVLFNYPGQSFSLFNPDTVYNNEYLSNVVDLLIYELAKRKVYHIKSDNIKFIGFGLGCNVILHFLISTNQSISTIKSCLLFNCYFYLDHQLASFITQAINVWSNASENSYSSLLFDSSANKTISSSFLNNISRKSTVLNTTTNESRITIMKGCLEIYNLCENINKIKDPFLFFVNSSHNNLITNSQKTLIESLSSNTPLQDLKGFSFEKRKDHKFTLNVSNSGYNLLKDQPGIVTELIGDFLAIEFPSDINQRISFIDKLLLVIEENMRTFFNEEVDNYNNFLEVGNNLVEFCTQMNMDIEFDFYEVINGFKQIKEKIDDLNEKIKKAYAVFNENYEEIKSKSDDLIIKIMNIQQKKLNEFSKYLLSIQKEIEIPLKDQIFLLKGFNSFLQIQIQLKKLIEICIFDSEENWRFFVEDEKKNNFFEKIKAFFLLKYLYNKKIVKYQNLDENLEFDEKKLQELIFSVKTQITPFFSGNIKKLELIFQQFFENIEEIKKNASQNFLNNLQQLLESSEFDYNTLNKQKKINLLKKHIQEQNKNETIGHEILFGIVEKFAKSLKIKVQTKI